MARRKLTDQQGRSIAARFLAGAARHVLAEEFGVSERTIGTTLRQHGVTAEDRAAIDGGRAAREVEVDPETAAEFDALGPPPEDPLKAVGWMHRALAISAWQAIRSLPSFDDGGEGGRRKELREIAKAMAACTPQTSLYTAKRRIEQDADELEKSGGPEMTDAPQVARRAHRVAPRRGRPRQL